MRRPNLAVLFVVASGWAVGQAQPPVQPQPVAAPHAVRDLIILDRSRYDPPDYLALPPQEGSQTEQYELDALRNVILARTPERLAQARWDDAHEDITIFSAAIGPDFDLQTLPRTAELLEIVRHDQAIVANIAKAYFKRRRPFVLDPAIDGCDHTHTNPLTSYPSGHATLGYSLGYTLKALIPSRAAVIQARADDYAFSRMVCGMHFRSDIEAGRVVGRRVADDLLSSPALASKLAAARAELKAAGIQP